MGLILNRDAILESLDLGLEQVDIPEWGGTVCIREMTAAERDALGSGYLKDKEAGAEMENFRAKLLVRVICDENRNRLFADDDIVILGCKSSAVLDRLFTVANRLNGTAPEAVDDLAKN